MSLSLSLVTLGGAGFEGLLRAEPPPLPGPGLDIPVDVDGDGVSTWGDRYAFNYWLGLGGNLGTALGQAQIVGDVIDLSAFFSSPLAALSPDTALSAQTLDADGASGSEPPSPQPLQECQTNATLHEAFQEEGAEQVYIVYCNPDLLPYINGHALHEGTIYLASDALYQVTGFDYPSAGTVPLDENYGSVFYRNDVTGPNDFYELQLDMTYGTAQLLATAWWRRPNGTTTRGVARFPITSPQTWCEEASTSLNIADALALLLDNNHPAFGNPGMYYVSRTTGTPGVLRDLRVAQGCVAGGLEWKFGASGPSGLALGTFDPTEQAYPFALYHTEMINGSPKIVERVPPFSQRRRTFDTGGFGAALLAFDPYSNTLFAASEYYVLRYRPDGTWVEFLSNLTQTRGLTFTWSGLLVVSEPGQLVGVDGWRYRFKRGDANGDLSVNISDAVYILQWLFQNGPQAPCWDTADVNDDSAINISDSDYLLQYLFYGGPEPPPPYSDLPGQGFGADPTADLFGCRSYAVEKAVQW